MRSVVVVLPASMWAIMPMFLHRSNGTVLGTTFISLSGAPRKRSKLRFYGCKRHCLQCLGFLTTGSARRPYWLRPYGEHLLSSLWLRLCHWRHPAIHYSTCRSCLSHRVRGSRQSASESPATCGGRH